MRLKDLESQITLTGRYEPLQENPITCDRFPQKNNWQVPLKGNVLLQQTRCVTLFGEIASGEVAYQKVKKIL